MSAPVIHVDPSAQAAEPIVHPAVAAWDRANAGSARPTRVKVLMEQEKSSVYRLCDAAPNGADVIAKRVSRARGAERLIYQSILPQLPVTVPRFFAAIDEDMAYWVFLEDVGQRRCRIDDPRELNLASEWVARLHTSASVLRRPIGLTDAGPLRYRTHLGSAIRSIDAVLTRGHLPERETVVLKHLATDLVTVDGHWPAIVKVAHRLPETLVHGDFLPKNVRLRTDELGVDQVLPIDWETVGWGSPAADLSHVHLPAYHAAIHSAWPTVAMDELDWLARVGRAFRWIAAIDWESTAAAFEHRQRALMRLAVYRDGLADALRGMIDLDNSPPRFELDRRSTAAVDILPDVARKVADRFPARLIRLTTETQLTRGSYQTRSLLTSLADGTQRRLILKEFAQDRYQKDSTEERMRREVLVYQRILPAGALGTAECYACEIDPIHNRYWLALEFVDAPLLKVIDPSQWAPVARWLAQLHTRVEDGLAALRQEPLLLRHDAEFFSDLARRAAKKLSRFDVALSERLRTALGGYDQCIDMMIGASPTFVHGSFRAGDILMSSDGSRVCPVDFERAAIGCRFFDLAYLTDLLPPEQRSTMLRAYLSESEKLGFPCDEFAAGHLFKGCLMHRTLVRLRKWARQHDASPAMLVGRVEQLMSEIARAER